MINILIFFVICQVNSYSNKQKDQNIQGLPPSFHLKDKYIIENVISLSNEDKEVVTNLIEYIINKSSK